MMEAARTAKQSRSLLSFPANLLERLDRQFGRLEGAVGVFAASLVAAALSWLISLFVFFPPNLIHSDPKRLIDFTLMCSDPLARHLREPILAYRVTTPLIAWVLGLRGKSGLIVQYSAVLLFLSAVYLLLRSRAGRKTAILGVIGIGTTFATIWPSGYPGFPDSVTYLLIALALFNTSPLRVCSLSILAMMNDERAILALPLIALWHVADSKAPARTTLTRLVPALAAAICCVALIRHALTVGWIGPGIETPSLYRQIWEQVILAFRPWDSTWPKFFFDIFMGYRWLWALLPLACLLAREPKSRRYAVLIAVYLLAASMTAMTVADVSRSTGYLFPGILLALLLVVKSASPAQLGSIARTVCIAQILTPVYYFVGSWTSSCRPFIFEAARDLTGFDLVHVLLYR